MTINWVDYEVEQSDLDAAYAADSMLMVGPYPVYVRMWAPGLPYRPDHYSVVRICGLNQDADGRVV